MFFNINYELCSLIFMVMFAVVFFYRKPFYNTQGIMYAFLLGISIINVLFHIGCVSMLSHSSQSSVCLISLGIFILWMTQDLLSLAYLFYLFAVLGCLKQLHTISYIRTAIPVFVLFLFMLVNPITKFMFTIDDSHRLFLNSGYAFVLIVLSLYQFRSIWVVVQIRKRMEPLQFWILMFHTLLLAAALLMQHMIFTMKYSGMVLVLVVCSLFQQLQDPDDFRDKTTGLYKRSPFLMKMDRILEKRDEASVIIVDLTNLKEINHQYGYTYGAHVIKQISEYFRSIRKRNQLFRIAPNRFAFIEKNDPIAVMEQVRARFLEAWKVKGTECNLSVSLCKIPITSEIKNKEMLLMMMDGAVSTAKKMGKSAYLELDETIRNQVERRFYIEQALHHAIKNDTIWMYFQPIYSVKEKRVTSAEALLRLEDPVLGFVAPDEFIEVAEECGKINELGEIAIRKTCQFIASNDLESLGITKIHINLSAVQCLQKDLVTQIKEIMKFYHVNYTMINFEITETAAIQSEGQLKHLMEELMACGASFSLDDYGKGYSNSDTILRFPFEMIKLDKEMLWNSFLDERAFILYKSSVQMMKELDFIILAEGAETKENVDTLKAIEIDYIQGFYYSRPLPPKQFLTFMKSW